MLNKFLPGTSVRGSVLNDQRANYWNKGQRADRDGVLCTTEPAHLCWLQCRVLTLWQVYKYSWVWPDYLSYSLRNGRVIHYILGFLYFWVNLSVNTYYSCEAIWVKFIFISLLSLSSFQLCIYIVYSDIFTCRLSSVQ